MVQIKLPQDRPVFQGVVSVLVALAILVVDIRTGFLGYHLQGYEWYNWLLGLFTAGGLVLMAHSFVSHWGRWKEGTSAVLKDAMFVLCGLLKFQSGWAWIRIVLIYIVYHFFLVPTIENNNPEEKEKWNIYMVGILVLDYVVLGSLYKYTGITKWHIPIYLIAFSAYFQSVAKSAFFTIVLTLSFAFLAFSFMGVEQTFQPGIWTADRAEQNAFVRSVKDFGESLATIPKNIQQTWNSTYNSIFNPDYYYDGQQEETDKPQGVYLEEMERGELIYREGNDVYVWARVTAKTLDEPIFVEVDCETELDIDFDTIPLAGTIESGLDEFTVFSGVEKTIPCKFKNLPEGDYDVKFSARFGFSGSAKKEVYLMRRERLMNDLESLYDRKDGPATKEEVLRELYDIENTEPESIFTTGPVGIGIETDKVPWDIGGENIKPLFGVTIENLWTTGGKIERINNLVLNIPNTMKIEPQYCDQPIEYAGEEDDSKLYIVRPDEETVSDIKKYVTVNCLMEVDESTLDNVPVTTRFLKVDVDYDYVIENEIDIGVEGYDFLDEEEEIFDKNTACCEYSDKGGSIKEYNWVASEEECLTEYEDSPEAITRVVDIDYCAQVCCISYEAGRGLSSELGREVTSIYECENDLAPGVYTIKKEVSEC